MLYTISKFFCLYRIEFNGTKDSVDFSFSSIFCNFSSFSFLHGQNNFFMVFVKWKRNNLEKEKIQTKKSMP